MPAAAADITAISIEPAVVRNNIKWCVATTGKRMKIMKKLSALIMFTLLATAGYYIGNAVAQNKTSADQQAPDGVLVVEETYGVAVPVQAASPTADSAAGSAAGEDTLSDERDRPAAGGADGKNAATPVTGSNNDGNGNTVVEETVTEEGYVEE